MSSLANRYAGMDIGWDNGGVVKPSLYEAAHQAGVAQGVGA